MSTFKSKRAAAARGKISTAKLLSTSALTAAGLLALAMNPARADDLVTPDPSVTTPDAPSINVPATPDASAPAWTGFTDETGSITTDVPDTTHTNITQNTSLYVGTSANLDIPEGYHVNIDQASSNYLFVAKAAPDADPTYILGQLTADGRVIIIDRNGVFNGPNSKIDVAGIIETTGDIDTAQLKANDFGKYTITGATGGRIDLQGQVTVANAGLAAFVAPTVVNSGVINAKMGKVAIASGEQVTLDLYGDNLVEIGVGGHLADALIENSGQINAEGGVVQISAKQAKEAVDNIINVSGVINAGSATQVGGKIILSGGDSGVVKVSGNLNANGEGGGKISVTGQNVLVTDAATLSVDGGTTGNGGEARIVGDNAAIVRGKITALGGTDGGDGGFVEVSGLNYLDFVTGNVDTTAANGETGMLLIDPNDILIRGGTGDGDDIDGMNPNRLGDSSNGIVSFTDTNLEPYLITEKEIEQQSTLSNITIQARHSVTTQTGAGLDNNVTLAANHNLTIETLNDAAAGTGVIDLGNLAFTTSGTGSINVHGATSGVNNSDVTLGTLNTGAGGVNVNTKGQIFVNGVITTANGAVNMNATDRIFVDNDIITHGGAANFTATNFTTDNTIASGSPDDFDKILTSGGDVLITADNVNLGETTPIHAGTIIDAGLGAVTITRKTDGSIALGDGAVGDTKIGTQELNSIHAGKLNIGDLNEATSKVTNIDVSGVDTTANIAGLVTLSSWLNIGTGVPFNAVGTDLVNNNNVGFIGANKFNSLTVNANDHVVLYTLPTVASITTNGDILLNTDDNAQGVGGLYMGSGTSINSQGHNVTFNGHEVFLANNAKINAAGGNILLNNDDIFFSENPDSLTTDTHGTVTLNQWDKSINSNGGLFGTLNLIGSINNAVQALNNTGNGLNTVHVGAGTYDENVIVNQKNILIRSMAGRDTTIVNGSNAFAGQGTFDIAGGINNTQIGETAHGFTINGFDGPTPGIERAAVYYTGAHTTSKLQGNKIVANGDEAIVTEYGQANSGITIDNNIITGNTFTGADGAWGTGDQFVNPNVPRQLVALNLGNSNVTFSNNAVTGNAGDRQLVAIESAGANVFGNTFDGLSTAAALRVRGSDVNVYNNDIDGNGRGVGILAEKVKNLRIGGPLVADGNDVDFTGGDAIAVIDGNLNLGTTNITNNRIGQLGGANSIGSGANGGDGIFVKNTDNAVIKKNTIKNAHINAGLRKGSGILVVQSDNAQIGAVGEGNIIDNSGSDGIVIRTDGGSNDGNKIVGNTITGALDSRTGIYTELATNTTIDQNTVSGSGRYAAIYGYGGSDFKITKNILKNNDEMGILVQSAGGTNLIDGNKIDNTGEDVKASDGTNSGDAIHVTNTTGLTISNNEIGKNGGNIQGDGVYVSGSNGVVIKTNKINDTRFKTADANGANGSGIQVVNTAGATIGEDDVANDSIDEGNTITNAQWDGIRLQNVDNVRAEGNKIDVTGRVGIWGGNINTATIKKNVVNHDGLGGYGNIHADGGSNWTVTGNDVDNGDYGIFLNGVGGTANKIDGGNKVDNMSANGIHVVNTAGLTVSGNFVGVNGGNVLGHGIFVDPSNVAQMFGNTITNVGGNGIWSLNNDDASIYGNTITGAGLDGILVQGGNNVNIGGLGANTVKKSGDDGIDVENTTGTVVVKNNVIDETGLNVAPNTDQNGIEVSGVTGVLIEGNKVNKAAWDGINVQQTTGATIKSNQIANTLGASGIGIHNGTTGTIVVDDNVITKALQFGMWIGDSTGTLNVTNNDISDITQSDGIYVNNSTGTININSNDIYKVGRHGIYGTGDIDQVNSNRIVRTGGDGILVTNSPYVDINSNKIGDSITGTNAATRLRTTNGTSISSSNVNSTANNIGDDGIHVENSNYADIIGNTVSNTNDDGIFIDPSDYSVIAGNTLTTLGNDGIESADNSYITIGGANTADGNTISGAGAHGINVHGGVEALIQNNTVKGGNGSISGVGVAGAQWDGIHVEDNDGVEILNNTITAGQGITITLPFGLGTLDFSGGNGANNHGIYVYASDNAVIDQNLVLPDLFGNGLGAGVDGIHAEDSNNLTVGGLIPLLNGNKIFSTGRDGINIDGSNNAFVLNNIISGASFDLLGLIISGEIGDDGIDMNDTTNTIVAGNIITDTHGDGIEFSNGTLSLMALNFITNAGDDGIDISDSGLLALLGNQIDGTVHNGIELSDTYLTLTALNTVNDAGDDGINVQDSIGTFVVDNTITGAGDDGIDFDDTLLSFIIGNDITSPDGDGIEVSDTALSLISDNTITDAGDDGIDLDGVLLVGVTGNTVDNADNNGIEASNALLTEISDNYISDSGDNGIDLRDSGLVSISGNTVSGSGDNGIFVDPSFGIDIIGNTVSFSGLDGIHVEDVIGLNIEDNTVLFSAFDGIDVDGILFGDITDNTVAFSGDNGIEASDIAFSDIDDNTVLFSRNDGINVNGSLFAGINGNHVFFAGDDGIDVRNSNFADINNNRIFFTRGDGIQVRNSDFADIDDNFIRFAGDDGIDYENGHGSEINGNNIRFVNNSGIEIDDSHFITADSNIISNADVGILIDPSSQIHILNNKISNTDIGLYAKGQHNGYIEVTGNTFTDNTIGAKFESGIIDLTKISSDPGFGGYGNKFFGGDIALVFDAKGHTKQLSLVRAGGGYTYDSTDYDTLSETDTPTNFGGTIGNQYFDGQAVSYVELQGRGGTFVDPTSGDAIWLDASNSTFANTPFGTFSPADTNGVLTQPQFDYLESMFYHYPDASGRGIFWFGAVPQLTALDARKFFDEFDPFNAGVSGLNVTITGLPKFAGLPAGSPGISGLNQIAPAAGDEEGADNTTDVAKIEPAAGDEPTGSQNVSCWGDAVNAAGTGTPVSYSYGGTFQESIAAAATCGSQSF